MVALKDKRKWTVAEYKGEHERGSRDMNYYSFHDANPNKWYYSPPCAFSLFLLGPFFFFSSQHRKCVRTPCESKYSMSVQSSLPLTTWCVSISALSISILQLYREGERESEQACVRHYVCFIIAVRRDAHSRHIWGVITSAGISCLSNGREQTWLRSASFVLDWAACKHHMLFVLWPHSPPPPPSVTIFFFSLQSITINKWLCAPCLQYACIDPDSNFVPLCRRRHLESCLESGQTTCSQFASH